MVAAKAGSARSDLLGAVRRSRRAGGFGVIETAYVPGMVLPWHEHEHANFCFVLAGGYQERYGTRSRTCEPGTFVVHPAGERHADVHGSAPVRLLTVEIDPRRLRAMPDAAAILRDSLDARGTAYERLSGSLEREFRNRDAASNLALEALVLEILAIGMRGRDVERGAPPAWLQRLVAEVDAEPAAEHTMSSLAAKAGVHPTHLARMLRRHYGCSVGAYVRARRVRAACGALRAGTAPLAAIAADAGFADQSHFARVFRAVMGMSPSDYRREPRLRAS